MFNLLKLFVVLKILLLPISTLAATLDCGWGDTDGPRGISLIRVYEAKSRFLQALVKYNTKVRTSAYLSDPGHIMKHHRQLENDPLASFMDCISQGEEWRTRKYLFYNPIRGWYVDEKEIKAHFHDLLLPDVRTITAGIFKGRVVSLEDAYKIVPTLESGLTEDLQSKSAFNTLMQVCEELR